MQRERVALVPGLETAQRQQGALRLAERNARIIGGVALRAGRPAASGFGVNTGVTAPNGATLHPEGSDESTSAAHPRSVARLSVGSPPFTIAPLPSSRR